MKFPHAIEIVRPTGTDAYGNPSSSFATVTRSPGVAFIVQKSALSLGVQSSINLALLPPDTDITPLDRVIHGDKTYAVVGEVVTASSPSKDVIKTATLQEVPSAA